MALITGVQRAISASMRRGIRPANCRSAPSTGARTSRGPPAGPDRLARPRVDLRDDRLGRLGGRDQPVPGVGLDVDAGSPSASGQSGSSGGALGRGDREDLHLARSRHAASPRSPACRPSARRRASPRSSPAASPIGNVHQLRAALERDRLHGEMRQRAVADRAEIVFAGLALEQRRPARRPC